jgi:hypothetical protein
MPQRAWNKLGLFTFFKCCWVRSYFMHGGRIFLVNQTLLMKDSRKLFRPAWFTPVSFHTAPFLPTFGVHLPQKQTAVLGAVSEWNRPPTASSQTTTTPLWCGGFRVCLICEREKESEPLALHVFKSLTAFFICKHTVVPPSLRTTCRAKTNYFLLEKFVALWITTKFKTSNFLPLTVCRVNYF